MKNKIIFSIIIIFLLASVSGGIFLFLNWREDNRTSIPTLKEEERMTGFLTNGQMQEDFNNAKKGEEDARKTPDVLLPYIQAGFYWKTLAEATKEQIFYDRAIEVLLIAINRFGAQNYLPYVNAGNIYQALGRFEEAEAMFKKAIEIVPGETSLYIRLAELYRYDLKKTPEEILAVYDEGEKRGLSSITLSVSKAGYLRDIGRKDEAIKIFEAAYEATKDEIFKYEIEQIRQ